MQTKLGMSRREIISHEVLSLPGCFSQRNIWRQQLPQLQDPADIGDRWATFCRHALFARNDDIIQVQDLDSQAGTFLNGTEVRGLTLIRPGVYGDRLCIGDMQP